MAQTVSSDSVCGPAEVGALYWAHWDRSEKSVRLTMLRAFRPAWKASLHRPERDRRAIAQRAALDAVGVEVDG